MSVTDSPELPTAPAVVRGRPGEETMPAIILTGFGGLDKLVYDDLPKPLWWPAVGMVLICLCLAGYLRPDVLEVEKVEP